jgi:hypothetical protein
MFTPTKLPYHKIFIFLSSILLILSLSIEDGLSFSTNTSADVLLVKHWQEHSVIPKYEVFEIIFQYDQEYDNPFLDMSIKTTFISPGGKAKLIERNEMMNIPLKNDTIELN